MQGVKKIVLPRKEVFRERKDLNENVLQRRDQQQREQRDQQRYQLQRQNQQNQQRKPRKGLGDLFDKAVVVQTLGALYEGRLLGIEGEYFVLEDVTIKGKNYVCKTKLLLLKKDKLLHLHLAPDEVVPVTALDLPQNS